MSLLNRNQMLKPTALGSAIQGGTPALGTPVPRDMPGNLQWGQHAPSLASQAAVGSQVVPPAAVPESQDLPTDMTSKWYKLSDQVANLQGQKDMSAVTTNMNAGLNQGLSALGFRGNNNAGSMERLGAKSAMGMGKGGAGAAQSRYANLAEMYGQGLQKIELPTLQGKDMATAIRNGNAAGDPLSNLFNNIF